MFGEQFENFCDAILIDNLSEIQTTVGEIAKKLNSEYYETQGDKESNIYIVGSIGRGTAIKNCSDVDLIFDLPQSVYDRFDAYEDNGQSALLQEIKSVLKERYPRTDMRGDGQVVVIEFDKYTIELVPGFKQNDDSFTYPDTHDGGSWKRTDPISEQTECKNADAESNGIYSDFCHLIRAWKNECGFKFGGLLIDTLVYNHFKEKDYYKDSTADDYFDFLINLLEYLKFQNKDQSYWLAVGSNQYIFRQDNISNYKRQTQARDDLKEQFRIRIAEINREIQSGSFSVSEALVQKLEALSLSFENHKGKKVYGYLSKKNKDMVDEIVKMVARDKKIVELYDLWYRLQCENYRNYTDQMPDKIPLESNKEFKSLRNFVVRSASEMITDIPEPSEFDDDYLYHRKYGDNETVLRFKAEDGYPHEQYLYARACLENDDPEEAEHWLKQSASKGNRLAMYMLYKCYRDGKIEDREGEKMKYLLMAVDKEYGFAEYEYSKLLSKT